MASASLSRGKIDSWIHEQTPAAASYYRHVTQKFHGNRIFISRMLNRNPKRLSAEVFSSAQKQPKQNASNQNREENGSTTLRNTREKPLLAGYRWWETLDENGTTSTGTRRDAQSCYLTFSSAWHSGSFSAALSFTLPPGKKVVSHSTGLVDFAIGLVNSVFNLPDGQVKFYEEFE